MLKSGILVVSTFFLIQLVRTETSPAEAIDFCRDQEKLTEEDITNWMTDNLAPNPTVLKCFEACIAEQTGLFVDNKLNVDEWMDKIDETHMKDEETKAMYKEIVNECAAITDEDRCEMVEKVLECLRDAPVDVGLDPLI